MSATEFDVISPVDETIVKTVPLADRAEVDARVARAHRAFAAWRLVTPGDRARLLRRFAQAVEGDIETLAALEVRNAGHTVGNARWEAGNVRDVINYYSAAPERLTGRQIPVAGGIDITFHEPLGVVGVIVPWNFPMPIAAWGFAPALAAGNTVIVKPAQYTPLTALRLEELALEAGLPPDVLQVVAGTGTEAGEHLVGHPLVRKIVFTGSTAVGKRIMRLCADQVKPLTLELGGKNANIVFADADLERAAASAPGAAFDNAGQDCCARSRVLVQRSAFDRFMELLEPAVKNFTVGDPVEPGHGHGTADLGAASRVGQLLHRRGDGRGVSRHGSAGAGLLVPAHRAGPGLRGRPAVARGDLRPGARRHAVRGRGGRHPAGQRHGLRPFRIAVDPRPRAGPAGRPRLGDREPVGELALIGAVLDALRRVQAVRPRPGTRPGRRRGVHRDQERLHLDRGVTRSAGCGPGRDEGHDST